MLLCVGDCFKKCVFFFVCEKSLNSPYKPEDYLAASEYKICDDGRRQAGAYFMHKHVTNATHEEQQNATANGHKFHVCEGRRSQNMYVVIQNRKTILMDKTGLMWMNT